MSQARDSTGFLFWVCILPHAGYLAQIGGDHFEYRPHRLLCATALRARPQTGYFNSDASPAD